MSRIVVVGSGASGVHFALTALRKGHEVVMLDAGHARPPVVRPGATISELKEVLEDPVSYFLGDGFEGLVIPGTRETYYGFPPSKSYVFATPQGFSYRSGEMKPYFTFARGGFAETWTAGAYVFTDRDVAEFPIDYRELQSAYQEVARRIGLGGTRDDLERFMPFGGDYQEPLELDEHSERLLQAYRRQRISLNQELRWFLGRSRVATASRDFGGRKGCSRCGRCLWGCPTESIYTPVTTLRECLTYPRFSYRGGLLVTHFDYDADGQVTTLHAVSLASGEAQRIQGDLYVAAAGTLMSSKLFLDSIYRSSGEIVRLPGLMDNRQIHVPFLTPAMIGRPAAVDEYQFHHLAFGIEGETAREYVHGQITTLKAAAVHPIVQSLPFDMRTALQAFRSLRSGLGIANVNLHDYRRPESYLTIEPLDGDGQTRLVLNYVSAPDEPARMRRAVGTVKRALRRMGAFVPPGLTRVLPKGASVHYAGTLPMSPRESPLSCTPQGRSYRFPNLFFADGATFPFLPAKNHTFTLMANAVRMAEHAL